MKLVNLTPNPNAAPSGSSVTSNGTHASPPAGKPGGNATLHETNSHGPAMRQSPGPQSLGGIAGGISGAKSMFSSLRAVQSDGSSDRLNSQSESSRSDLSLSTRGSSERLSRESLRNMEAPSESKYYLAKPELSIAHFGPGKIARGLFFPKVEQASRQRYVDSGKPLGITAFYRSEKSDGYDAMRQQVGLFSYQTVGDEMPSDSSSSSSDRSAASGQPQFFRPMSLSAIHELNTDAADLGSASIIGCVHKVSHLQDMRTLYDVFTAPELKIVSASLTAAAYEESSQQDIDADVKALQTLGGNVLDISATKGLKLKTSFGAMLLGLMQRYALPNRAPVTLLALENLKNNGAQLKSTLVKMAEELEKNGCAPKGFTQALRDNVKSPAVMIDRIVPKPPERVLCRTSSSFYECSAGVVTEPHGRIVVEQDMGNLDANLSILGNAIEVTDQLQKHADAKEGLLNAVHALSGGIWMSTASEAKTLSEFLSNQGTLDFFNQVMCEISDSLDPIDNFDMKQYKDQILARLQNEQLSDEMTRLSSQLPRKIKQYIAPVVQRILDRGTAAEGLMDALNVVLNVTLAQEPARRDEFLNALAGDDSAKRSILEQKLQAATQKASALGEDHVLRPFVSIEQPLSESLEAQGLDLTQFQNNPRNFAVQLNPSVMVLFDNDGTLVNSESIALKAAHGLVSEIMSSNGFENTMPLAEFRQRFAGKNFSLILSELNQERMGGKLSAKEIEAYSHEEDRRCESAISGHVTATPHTLQTIEWIPPQQKSVVTSAAWGRCHASLNTLKVRDKFDGNLFSAVDSLPTPRPKPDPAIYQLALRELQSKGGASTDFVVLEDSPSGVRSAKGAGIDYVIGFVGADNLTSAEEKQVRAAKLRASGATDIIDDMALLPLVLEKRGLASRVDESQKALSA